MASLAPPPRVECHQQLPAPIREAIIDRKREYPARNTHEITSICWARFGQRPSPRTVKRSLTAAAPAPLATRRFPPYHAFADPVAARLAIIRLHLEGWNITSIAGYVGTGRRGVAHRPAHATVCGPRCAGGPHSSPGRAPAELG
jgi:putative transposase